MKTFYRISFALVFLTTAAFAETPIKIGYTLALTGKDAFVGIQSRAGAQLAAREFTKSNIPVEIVFEDHQADPKMAVSSTKNLSRLIT